MGKMFYITGSGLRRVVYTTKSGAKYIRSKSGKRYLSIKQIKDSHKRKITSAKKVKTAKKKTNKKKTSSKKSGFFSLWGG